MIDCRNYALKLITIKDRTEKEIRNKLSEKNYDENIIEDEIEFLKAYKYIDDDRFARLFIKDALNIKNWGKGRIVSELIRKGISSETVNLAMEEAFFEDDLRLLNEMQRRFKNSDLSNIKERRRIFSFYMRRGFSPNEIKGAMNKLCSFEDIIDE